MFKSLIGLIKAKIIENPIGSLVFLLIMLWLAGVRFYNQQRLEYGDIRIAGLVENLATIGAAQTAKDLAEAHHFAVLSAEVYGEANAQGRPIRDWEVENCEHDQIYQQWQVLELPADFPSKPFGETSEQASLDSPLTYKVWFADLNDDEIVVVLAFAGTDDLGDIWSNAHWLTRYWPGGWSQYEMAATVGAAVEDYVRNDRFSNASSLRIVTAGHSLGGGLAHVAAYSSETIKQVYAFDSSSVTGFYDVEKSRRDASKQGMRIYRIHERGEILGYLRAFMRAFYPSVEKNPAIVDATINFDSGLPIGQHSIENLACAMLPQSSSKSIL